MNRKAETSKQKKRAIFIDRDGTINVGGGLLTDINDFRLLPGVGAAIKMINESGYLAVVITNQPVVARGEVTLDELQKIHEKMKALIGVDGGTLDAVYFCPHYPDPAFQGGGKELLIECECYKPKSGMLFRAAEELNIDLKESWMVGDHDRDVLCGKGGGCRTAIIGNDERADYCGESLLDCVQYILERERRNA